MSDAIRDVSAATSQACAPCDTCIGALADFTDMCRLQSVISSISGTVINFELM